MTLPPTWRIAPLAVGEVPAVCALAREIWYQHYPGIITVRQIEYMLDQRYRPETVRRQIESGEAWWDKLEIDGRLAGFAQYERGLKPASVKLDKIYLHPCYRGKGFGSALLQHVEAAARSRAMRTLYLQVNRGNSSSVAVYRRNGFKVTGETRVDIGGGFYMDDYVMEKAVTSDK